MGDEGEDRNVDGSEPTEGQNAARALCVEATQTWIDSFEGFEGSVVTGYVLIMETQRLGEVPVATWMSGNGVAPEGEAAEGLATHKVVGLIESARQSLVARKIAEELRRQGIEG